MRLLPIGVLLSVALLSLWISTMTGSGYSGPTLLTDGRTSQSWTFLRTMSAQELAVPAPTAGTSALADDASSTVVEDATDEAPGVDGLVLAQPEAVVPSADGKTAIELVTGVPGGAGRGDLESASSARRIRRVPAPVFSAGASGTGTTAGLTGGAVPAPTSTATTAPRSTSDSVVGSVDESDAPTNTTVPAAATGTPAPLTPTNTTVPATATHTAVPSTATITSVPPTATHTAVPPTATNTSVPPAATNTPATATDTPEPPAATATAIPSSTPTPTPVPPAPTSTDVPPTPTPTPIPPTATATPDVAAAARTATARALVPANETVVSISTPTPTHTSTPLPTATKTPTPTPTRTPTSVPPTPTNTATPTTAPALTATPAQGTRDAYAWPCAGTSIWNMAIGSAASYVAAGIQNANGWNNGEMTTDEEFIGLNPGDPLKSLNGTQVHVPPAISWDGSWNGVAAFLSSDGHSVIQGQPLVLSPGGDPAWQYSAPTVDIKGDCVQGAHGGSGLSSFGGTLRKGEMASSQALHHALKINVYAKRFLSCSSGGYRWPAIRADSYMDCATYGGAVSQMRMGSLVALRPAEDCTSYGSVRARKICQALQDYGAYVVDDTFWDVHAIDIESGAEFSDGGSFDSDLQAMFTHLAVVDNNGPSSIGGGGTPRQPLAPAFGN